MPVIPNDGFRYYGKLYNTNHGAPAFMYLYDSGIEWQNDAGQIITGAERPVVPSDLASTSEINVSGGLSVSVGNVAVTGGTIAVSNTVSVDIVDPILPVSGIVTVLSLPTQNVAVTGGSIVTIVTGQVQSSISNPIGVTGTKLDAASIYATNPAAPYNFVAGGGRVVNPSGAGSVTGSYTTGQLIINNYAPNGGLYVNQGNLDSGYDSVLASVQGGNVVPVNVTGIILTQVTGAVSASFDSSAIVSAQSSGNNNTLGILFAQQSGDAFLAAISGKLFNGIAITGGTLSSSFDSTSIVLAQASGNALLTTNNVLLSGVSGQLSANLDSAAFVTGTVVAVTNSASTVSANSVSGLVAGNFGVVLPNNPARKSWYIQNLGTGVLMGKMSATIPSTGTLDFILKGATTAYAGDGAIWSDSVGVYTGPVAVSGLGGANCVYVAKEM